MHLLVVPMLVALMWHQINVAIFCVCILFVYGSDRLYMVLSKTCAPGAP